MKEGMRMQFPSLDSQVTCPHLILRTGVIKLFLQRPLVGFLGFVAVQSLL